jgi:hypothetical protein
VPPCLILDSYMAASFAGAWVGPPLALAHSNAFASVSGDGLIRSPSVSLWGYESSTAVASGSTMAVTSIISPGKYTQSSSWCPDPDSYNVSSLNNYGGHCLAYGGSYPYYGGSGMPSSSQHSNSWFGSYVGCPSRQNGGPPLHPQDVPFFIFPWDGTPIASGLVPHATALVTFSLGGTVAPLSSLCHAYVPSSSDSDLTMSLLRLRCSGATLARCQMPAAPPAVITVAPPVAVPAAPPAVVPVASPLPHIAPLGIHAELLKLDPINSLTAKWVLVGEKLVATYSISTQE